MLKMTGKPDVYSHIRTNKSVNLLAFAYTPWHSHGVAAVLKMLREYSIPAKGIVCICEHSQAGYILDDSFFEQNTDNIEVIKLIHAKEEGRKKKIINYFHELAASGQIYEQDFYLITPNAADPMEYVAIRRLRPECNVINCVIDEGLATYMRKPEDFYKNAIINQRKIMVKFWVYFRTRFLDQLLIKKIRDKSGIRDFHLLRMNDGKLSVNECSVKYYRSIFHQSESYDNNDYNNIYNNAIVINTQPFWDEKSIIADEDLRIIHEVCKKLKAIGEHIVLKPHPRESGLERYSQISEYAIIDERKNISQEQIFSSLNKLPKALLGFSSTTLVSAQLFFEIKTYSMVKFWDFETLDSGLALEQKRFLETFEAVVECPENIRQLVSEIEI